VFEEFRHLPLPSVQELCECSQPYGNIKGKPGTCVGLCGQLGFGSLPKHDACSLDTVTVL